MANPLGEILIVPSALSALQNTSLPQVKSFTNLMDLLCIVAFTVLQLYQIYPFKYFHNKVTIICFFHSQPWSLRDLEYECGKSVCVVCFHRLSELQRGENCIIVGTLYKQMKLKPSILKELSEQNGLVGGAIPVMTSNLRYTDPSDELILEDEVQRLSLSGSSDVDTLISGTVIALFGQVPDEHTGKFVVDEIVYQEMPDQVSRSVLESDRYVAAASV